MYTSCGHNLSNAISKVSKEDPSLDYCLSSTCIERQYITYNTCFYPSMQCVDISDKCYYNSITTAELLRQLKDLSMFINNFSFSNCSQVFIANNSAPSNYYKIRSSNGLFIFKYCNIVEHINGLFLSSCSQIFLKYGSAPSSYYKLRTPNGSLILVYCDMKGSKCDVKGG